MPIVARKGSHVSSFGTFPSPEDLWGKGTGTPVDGMVESEWSLDGSALVLYTIKGGAKKIQ